VFHERVIERSSVDSRGFVLKLRDRRKSFLDSVTMCGKHFLTFSVVSEFAFDGVLKVLSDRIPSALHITLKKVYTKFLRASVYLCLK
jgi:hypothetical protein